MIAMFTNVREYAIFNSKPHLFTCGEPYQVAGNSDHGSVFVKLQTGGGASFTARVEQFGGVVLGE